MQQISQPVNEYEAADDAKEQIAKDVDPFAFHELSCDKADDGGRDYQQCGAIERNGDGDIGEWHSNLPPHWCRQHVSAPQEHLLCQLGYLTPKKQACRHRLSVQREQAGIKKVHVADVSLMFEMPRRV